MVVVIEEIRPATDMAYGFSFLKCEKERGVSDGEDLSR